MEFAEGRESVLWRKILGRNPICPYSDACKVYYGNRETGHCCWDCPRLEKCIPTMQDLYDRKLKVKPNCPYQREQPGDSKAGHVWTYRWCSRILKAWKEYKGESK